MGLYVGRLQLCHVGTLTVSPVALSTLCCTYCTTCRQRAPGCVPLRRNQWRCILHRKCTLSCRHPKNLLNLSKTTPDKNDDRVCLHQHQLGPAHMRAQRRTSARSMKFFKHNRQQDTTGACTFVQPVRSFEAGLAVAHLVAAINHCPCAHTCRESVETRRFGYQKWRVSCFFAWPVSSGTTCTPTV